MTTPSRIPESGVLSRKSSILVNCDQQTAYDLISSTTELPHWLKQCGKIPGAQSVSLIDGPYNHVGAQRKIHFNGGASAVETLLTMNPPMNYSYHVNSFSNFLEKISGSAFGQLWFDREGGQTRITWTYYFHYKNFLDRIVISLFLSFTYKAFLKQSLQNAKVMLESGWKQ